MTTKLVLGVGAILLAVIYSWLTSHEHGRLHEMEEIIKAWGNVIRLPDNQFQRVALGVNANVDLIVRAVALLEALDIAPDAQADHAALHNYEELQEAFHHFFAKGAAVERFYADTASFHSIVKRAAALDSQEWSVGGNAALMAQKMAQEFPNVQVQLVGPVGPKLMQLLPSGVQVPNYSHGTHDEVHLIMEYGVGEKWGETSTPVATRFITSSDKANGDMTSLEPFFSGLASYNADLVVLSGLHLLDSNPIWREKMEVIGRSLQQVPHGRPLHLELASMADKDIMSSIIQEILPKASSVGLNEQELAFFSLVDGGPHSDMNNQGAPEVYKVMEVLAWILKKYGPSEGSPDNNLSRIHLHSLTFHVIATVTSRWSNQLAAVAASARVAGQQACDKTKMSPELYMLPFPQDFVLPSGESLVPYHLNASEPARKYRMGEIDFYFSPVLVCREPHKTVGLGDAISATALLYSQFDYEKK